MDFFYHKTNSTLAFITIWVVHGMASVAKYNATFALQPNFTEVNEGPFDFWKFHLQIQ